MKKLLDGLLLGDGSLDFRGQGARYRHTCKHREYVELIRSEMESYGVKFTATIYEKPNGYGTGVGYQIYSRNYYFFTENYSRWYTKDKKKIVPLDLILTPESVKHWYIGDGGFDSVKGYLRKFSISELFFFFAVRDIIFIKILDIWV